MEFVVNIITLNVPVAAKDINVNLQNNILKNIKRLYEKERNYYQYGVLYYDTIQLLDIKPGIKDGSILNDEMVFEVTLCGLFKLYVKNLSYYGYITETTVEYYLSRINPCYSVIIPKSKDVIVNNEKINVGDLFLFTVKDISSMFSQGNNITIVGEELSRGNNNIPTYNFPAYLTNNPYVISSEDNDALGTNFQVIDDVNQSGNNNYYCITTNYKNLAFGDVLIADKIDADLSKKFAEVYKYNNKEYGIFYLKKDRSDIQKE